MSKGKVNIISFDVEGDFAAFKDPTVTTSQSVYYAPSKSAVIGFIGAILGIERGNELGEIYSNELKQILKITKIGIRVNSNSRKISFFTNHRSLKKPGVKPFKTELLLEPKYTFFIQTSDEDLEKKIYNAIKTKNYYYSPFLGHAYCLARISNLKIESADKIEPKDKLISTIVLDETNENETNSEFELQLVPVEEKYNLIIERHLYHYIDNEKLERRVFRYWIPISNSKFQLKGIGDTNLSIFLKTEGMNEDEAICLF